MHNDGHVFVPSSLNAARDDPEPVEGPLTLLGMTLSLSKGPSTLLGMTLSLSKGPLTLLGMTLGLSKGPSTLSG